jgi:hypothetical protein
MVNIPKKFGSPVGNFYNPTADSSATSNYINRAINSSEDAYKSFLSQDYIRPEIEKQLSDQLKLKKYNSEFNSLNILASKAYGDNTAKNYSTDMYNRIQSAGSKEELNALYADIEKLKDDTYEPFIGGSTVFSFVEPIVSRYNYFKNSLFDSSELTSMFSKLENNNDKLSEEDKNSIYSNIGSSGLFDKATASINQKRQELESIEFTQNTPDFFKQLDKSLKNINDPNALNGFLKTKFRNKTTTRGDEFYRDDQEEISNIYNSGIRAIDDPSRRNEKLFKYDLEKSTIQTLQTSLVNRINQVNSIPEEQITPEIKEEKQSLVNTLNKLEERTKNLSKTYGLNTNSLFSDSIDRSHFLRSVVATAAVPLANLSPFRSEFEKVLQSTQIYQPEVISYDKDNKPIMSNQFTFTKKNGEIGYNWGAVSELGGTMIGIIIPTLATSSLVGGVVSGAALQTGSVARGAASLQKGYSQLNKVGGLKLADRLATFATVGLTTSPMMIQEEKRWGGNYIARGLGKSLVEGLTEAVGFPDVGALRASPFILDLGSASRKIASVGLTGSERLAMGLSAAGQFGKAAVKQNIVEAFEEELSLMGNAILEHSMFDQSMFEDGRERTEVDGDTILDTFIESFIGGIIYSGGSNIVSARKTLSKDNLYNTSNWQAVNNPELFKAKLLDLKEKGKISEDEFTQGLGRVNDLQSIFKANVASLSKMKDIRTLLDDKDQQYELFTTAVRQNDLIGFDLDSLSEEDKAKLGKIKYQELINEKGKKRLNTLREEIAVLNEMPSRTEEQEKELIDKNNKYSTLRKISRARIDRKDLSKSEIDTLASLGIVENPNLVFTQEEYDKEIKDIDTAILKIKKQINKYEDLSEVDKQNIIIDLFDERINALEKVDSPSEIVQSRANLQKDLEYLKVKGESNKFDIEQRERLYDAYGKRFAELTNRGENNLNQVESKFDQPGYYSQFREGKNIFTLFSDIAYLEENKEFIDQTFYNTVYENLLNSIERSVTLLTDENTTPEKRIEILTEFYDKIASTSPLTLYDLERTNSLFTLTEPVVDKNNNVIGEKVIITPNFTREEMEAARENAIQKRAKRASSKIANGEKPYDEGTTQTEPLAEERPASVLSEEEQADTNSKIDKIFKGVEEDQAKPTTDEDTTIPQSHIDAKNLYEANKDKTVPQLKEIAGNIARRIFAYNNNPKSQFQLLVKLGNDFFDGKITYEEYDEGINDLIEKYPTKLEVLLIHSIFVGLVQNSGKVVYMGREAGSKMPTETAPKETKTNEDPSIQKRDSEVNQINVVRVAQLLSLASPLRTVGVELDENNEASEDPAELRRVNHIKKASSSDFETKVKIALVNRQKFMMMYLEKKYPNKSKEEIDTDLKLINSFFENSTEGDAIPSEIIRLLGDTFFSTIDSKNGNKSQVNFWQSQKGKGFSQSPDVVVTFVNEDGSMYLFDDGFPLDLNTASRSQKRANRVIPWNVSNKRVIDLLAKEGFNEERILKYHAETFENFEKEKQSISEDNNKVVIADYEITEGVFISKASAVPGEVLVAQNNTEVGKPNLEAFALVTKQGQDLFGQRKKFELGRLYFNLNGTPVRLSNNLIAKEEAEALADLIFTNEFPDEFDGIFDNLDEFRDYLFNIINDTNKESRLYFKPNREYEAGTNESAPHTNVLQKKDGKLKQLSKEEFIEVLQKSYYKVSNSYISNNKSIPRFEKVDNNIQITRQPYVDYLLSTHSFPVDSDGKILKNVNQLIYFNIPNLVSKKPIENTSSVEPKTPIKVPTETPVIQDENTDAEGFSIASKSSPFMPDNKLPTLQVFIGSRLNTIEKLKASGKAKNTVDFFSRMTDSDFEKFIQGLTDSNFIHYNVFDQQGKNVEYQDLFYSVGEDKFIMIEIEGTKYLIPISNNNDAVFNLRYQPTTNRIFVDGQTKLESARAISISVGVKPNAKVESNKKNITVDTESAAKDVMEDDTFEDDVFEDIDEERAKETIELMAAIPNLNEYRVNGVIDKSKMSPRELADYERIYAKYNKTIAPLIEEQSATTDDVVDKERRRQEDNNLPSRKSVKYKLQNKIAGINNPSPGNEVSNLSEAIKIAGAQISNPIQITEGEITHVIFDQEESTFRFTYKKQKFASFYIANAKGNVRWEIAKFNDNTNTYQFISLDELKNINEKYGSQKDLLLSLGAEDLVKDIEEFEKVEYSKKDKSSANGIIPLENTVSAEQIRLGKKYGVTYTLESFLREYDAELAALEQPVVKEAPAPVEKNKPSRFSNKRNIINQDPEIVKEAQENKKFCNIEGSTSGVSATSKKKKIGKK